MITILVDPRPERDTGSPAGNIAAFRRPALVALILLTLTGCGLKGDLYLPDDPTAVVPPATVEDDSDAENEDAA